MPLKSGNIHFNERTRIPQENKYYSTKRHAKNTYKPF